MGSIYKRGNIFWVKYYRNGKPYQESSRSKVKQVAKALLKRREGEISQGKVPGIVFDKVTFDELAEDLIRDYEINGRKSLARVKNSVRHLSEFFGGWKVPNITTTAVDRYIKKRIGAGVANATVNRELSALKRALNLAAQQTPPKVNRVPFIKMLKENNARQGFFEHNEFLAVRDHLPEYLKGLMTFAYKTGWRVSEISGLTWSQVDLVENVVRLEVGSTKSGAGRTIYLDDELRQVIQDQQKRKRKDRALSPWVFPGRDGTNKINFHYKSWKTACKKAGVGKKLFHDLRRTAVRNMVRAGISERVAMMVSGHKTRTIFDRYDIVNSADLKLAAKQLSAHLEAQNGYNLATIGDFKKKKEVY